MSIVNFDNLIIDRCTGAWFERNEKVNDVIVPKVFSVLDQVTNFSVNTSSETKDKTDAQGGLLKRFFTAKSVEVSGENALFSLDLHALQTGSDKKTGTDVKSVPRILQFAKPATGNFIVELPDTPNDGTLIVTGTSENGIADVNNQYSLSTEAGDNKYIKTETDGVTKLSLPSNATQLVIVKYEYDPTDGVVARVDQLADKFPKECKATFQILCSDKCDTEEVVALYVVFPKFQMSPDVDLTFDTESGIPFNGTAFKTACGSSQVLYYICIAEDSDNYDTKPYV